MKAAPVAGSPLAIYADKECTKMHVTPERRRANKLPPKDTAYRIGVALVIRS